MEDLEEMGVMVDSRCPVCKECFSERLNIPKIKPCGCVICESCIFKTYKHASIIRCETCDVRYNVNMGEAPKFATVWSFIGEDLRDKHPLIQYIKKSEIRTIISFKEEHCNGIESRIAKRAWDVIFYEKNVDATKFVIIFDSISSSNGIHVLLTEVPLPFHDKILTIRYNKCSTTVYDPIFTPREIQFTGMNYKLWRGLFCIYRLFHTYFAIIDCEIDDHFCNAIDRLNLPYDIKFIGITAPIASKLIEIFHRTSALNEQRVVRFPHINPADVVFPYGFRITTGLNIIFATDEWTKYFFISMMFSCYVKKDQDRDGTWRLDATDADSAKKCLEALGSIYTGIPISRRDVLTIISNDVHTKTRQFSFSIAATNPIRVEKVKMINKLVLGAFYTWECERRSLLQNLHNTVEFLYDNYSKFFKTIVTDDLELYLSKFDDMCAFVGCVRVSVCPSVNDSMTTILKSIDLVRYSAHSTGDADRVDSLSRSFCERLYAIVITGATPDVLYAVTKEIDEIIFNSCDCGFLDAQKLLDSLKK